MAQIGNSVDRFNGVVTSLAIKVRCVVAAITDIPFTSGAPDFPSSVNGVALSPGDRVLLTAQTNAIENGIWEVPSTGLSCRAPDWDGSRDIELGTVVFVGQSGGMDDTLWQVTGPAGTILVGTTPITLTNLVFGAGAFNLQDVTDNGNTTDNDIEIIDDGDLIIRESQGRQIRFEMTTNPARITVEQAGGPTQPSGIQFLGAGSEYFFDTFVRIVDGVTVQANGYVQALNGLATENVRIQHDDTYGRVETTVSTPLLLSSASGNINQPNAQGIDWDDLLGNSIEHLTFELVAAPDEPFEPQTELYLSLDGAAAATSYTDRDGNVFSQINASATLEPFARFGPSSLRIAGGVPGGFESATPSFPNAAGDFHIGFWYYLDDDDLSSSFTGGNTFVGRRNTGDIGWRWRLVINNGDFGFNYRTGSPGSENVFRVFGSATSRENWVYLAVERDAGVIRGYINGSQLGGDIADANTLFMGGGPTNVLHEGFSGIDDDIYVDDVLVLIGTNLYGGASTITPPSAPANPDGDTETLVVGDPQYRTDLDGYQVRAYNPTADDFERVLTESDVQATISAGTIDGQAARWDVGNSQYEPVSEVAFADTRNMYVGLPVNEGKIIWVGTISNVSDERAHLGFDGSSLEYEIKNLTASSSVTIKATDSGLSEVTFLNANPNSDTLLRGQTGMRLQASAGSIEFQTPTTRFTMNNAGILDLLGNGTQSGVLRITEGTSEFADVAGQGQLWVRDDVPPTLCFTDDVGFVWELAGENAQIIAGNPGTEGNGIQLNGANYDSALKVSDIGSALDAQFIMHKHSSSFPPIMVAARSQGDVEGHTIVNNGDFLFSLIAAGWDGAGSYRIAGSIDCFVDGAPGAGDMPGRWELRTTPDGSDTQVTVLTLAQDRLATFSGDVNIESTSPQLFMRDTNATADEGNWIVRGDADRFRVQTASDASPSSGVQNAIDVTRTGTAVDQIILSTGGSGKLEVGASQNVSEQNFRLRSGSQLLVNTTDNASTALQVIGGAGVSNSVQLATNLRFDFLDDVRVQGSISVNASAPNTGINEVIGFIDVNGGITRVGSYNWSLTAWQPITISGTNILLSGQGGDITINPSSGDDILLQENGTTRFQIDNTNDRFVFNDYTLFLEERAAALADVAGYGQLWVRNDTPNVLVFTDDAGTDTVLGAGGGGIGGSIANNQLAIGSGVDTIDGSANLTWDDSTFFLQASIPTVDINGTNGLAENFVRSRAGNGGIGTIVSHLSGACRIVQTDSAGAEEDTWIAFARNGGVALKFNDADNFATISTGVQINDSIYVFEKAAANADVGGFGQLWVRDDTPNVLVFTDDAGNDTVLGAGGGVTATGTPVDNQVAVWDSASSIEGDANFTWDGTSLVVDSTFVDLDATVRIRNASQFRWENAGNTANLNANWNGTVLEFTANAALTGIRWEGLTAGETYEWRDGAEHRWYETTDTQYMSLVVDAGGPTFNLTSTGDEYDFQVNAVSKFQIENNRIVSAEPIYIQESAAAESDTAGFGQFWVRNDTPNTPMFTDDAGTDYELNANAVPIEDAYNDAGSLTLSNTTYLTALSMILQANQNYMFTAIFDVQAPAADDVKIRFSGIGTSSSINCILMESDGDTMQPIWATTAQATSNEVVIPCNGGANGQGQGTYVFIQGTINVGASNITLALQAAKNADTGADGFIRIYRGMQAIPFS